MFPGEKLRTYSQIAFAATALLLAGCAHSPFDHDMANSETPRSRGILNSLRPSANPALVARIREEDRLAAEKQKEQALVATQTAGAARFQPGLGRNLPGVSTDPISPFMDTQVQTQSSTPTQTQSTTQAQTRTTNDAAMQYYEAAYSTVPPPPPGNLANGLVPPPPAVTLSTQAQAFAGAMADSAANYYNNPYFNPFGIPAPQQVAAKPQRPAGLFGDSSARNQSAQSNQVNQLQYASDSQSNKHKADFVPITPVGMEARSPYKQRDDLRLLWKGGLKESVNLGTLAQNGRLIEELGRLEIGLPAESTKGNFNVSSRQVQCVFKSAGPDNRAVAEVRKIQTELVQAYYRYLCAYNKFTLAQQTVGARQQEVELSESDLERQRATADLAQSKNDLDSCKDDMHSAEFELAAASSPTATRMVISKIAGAAPSVEALAQGSAQSGNRAANRSGGIVGVFGSVFKHSHSNASPTVEDGHQNKLALNNQNAGEAMWADKIVSNKSGKFAKENNKDHSLAKINRIKNDNNNDSDLSPAPAQSEINVSQSAVSKTTENDNQSTSSVSSTTSNGNIAFVLKNVTVNPRKSVLTVEVKNSGSETFELNPDTIYIAEGNHKLAPAAMRADFEVTSIEPHQEVDGAITVFGRPWNDRLVVYLADGRKTVQLKR